MTSFRGVCRRCAVLDSKGWDWHPRRQQEQPFSFLLSRAVKKTRKNRDSRNQITSNTPRTKSETSSAQVTKGWEHREKTSHPSCHAHHNTWTSFFESPAALFISVLRCICESGLGEEQSELPNHSQASACPTAAHCPALRVSLSAAGRGGQARFLLPPLLSSLSFHILRTCQEGKVWRISPSLSSWPSHSKINSPQQRNPVLFNKFTL